MKERFSIRIDTLSHPDVLKALGHNGQEIGDTLERRIDDLIAETLELARIRAVFKTEKIVTEPDLSLLGISLPGTGIREHLKDSHTGALFAVTLGTALENRLRRYSLLEPDAALIVDAAASILVESACDRISNQFEEEMGAYELYTTERFSPGYSDLPLTLQPEILRVLDASRQIGLSCNAHGLLLPRKSVTAIIGVRDAPRAPRGPRCAHCMLRGRCKFGICLQTD